MDEYLKSLKPMPSPHRIKGRLSAAAKRGRKLFLSPSVGCADCHSGPLLTDLKSYAVGTGGKFDQSTDRFDTPALNEIWRTAPYLHDGRAATLSEVFTEFQHHDQHGFTSHLTPAQIHELAEFVLSQ